MADLLRAALTGAHYAIEEAENSISTVCDVLIVLRMALGVESGGLDPDQRAGVETVVMHAAHLAGETRKKISAASGHTGGLIA